MEDPQGLDVRDYQGSENPEGGVLMVKHTIGILPPPSSLTDMETYKAWKEYDLALSFGADQMTFDFMQ